jgi:hypothetical protein
MNGWSRAACRAVSLAALALAACGRGAPSLHRIDRSQNARAASAEVSRLLYERNLIADPEVHARMNAAVLAVSRDGVPAESVMVDFHEWLEKWTREHPDRVEAARVAARPFGIGSG